MPRKRPSDPGQDIKRSIKIMEDLVSVLTKFGTIPLKKGMRSNKVLDDSSSRKITEILKRASELKVEIEDLLDMAKEVKPRAGEDPRFQTKMASRVLQQFLESY